jgi:hypothetical protein
VAGRHDEPGEADRARAQRVKFARLAAALQEPDPIPAGAGYTYADSVHHAHPSPNFAIDHAHTARTPARPCPAAG